MYFWVFGLVDLKIKAKANRLQRQIDGPRTPRWLPQVEGVRCSVVEVFPLAKMPRIESQRLLGSTSRCQLLTAPDISNQRGPAHKYK